jgi:1,2-phenylacetyl-CoA epoxidase catalytic subunit
LVTAHLKAQISNVNKVAGIRTKKYNISQMPSSEVTEQYRQQTEEKLNYITLTEQDSGEKLWKRCKTIINSEANKTLGINKQANKGTWFDAEFQAATEA